MHMFNAYLNCVASFKLLQWYGQNMYVIQGDIILQQWPKSKVCFHYIHVQCISELCCKFQIPESNTVGRVAETRTVLQNVTDGVRTYG